MNSGERTVKIIGVVFSLIGCVLLGLTVFAVIYSFNFVSRAEEVTATITEIETRYKRNHTYHDAYVSYTYRAVDYQDVRINFYNSSMREGDNVRLLVDPEDPTHTNSRYIVFYSFIPLVGVLIFGGIGFTLLYSMYSKKKKKKYLLENGRLLHGIVDNIDYNYVYSVNGRHPYLVYCRYEDAGTGTVYKFKSDNLFFDPNHFYKQGDSVNIYVNPANYREYYVDVKEYTENMRVVDYT